MNENKALAKDPRIKRSAAEEIAANQPVPPGGGICPLCYEPTGIEETICWRCLDNLRDECH